MKKLIKATLFSAAVLAVIFSPSQVKAVEYGDEPSGEIELNKTVRRPSDGNFVDNLSSTDYLFSPGEEIIFKIWIKNYGDEKFDRIEINDFLPNYVELVSGQTEIDFSDLNAGDTREYEIKVKVVDADRLPAESGLFCLVNKAEVIADTRKDEDTAQVCIGAEEAGQVLGVADMPATGADLLFGLVPLVLVGIVGFLKRKN